MRASALAVAVALVAMWGPSCSSSPGGNDDHIAADTSSGSPLWTSWIRKNKDSHDKQHPDRRPRHPPGAPPPWASAPSAGLSPEQEQVAGGSFAGAGNEREHGYTQPPAEKLQTSPTQESKPAAGNESGHGYTQPSADKLQTPPTQESKPGDDRRKFAKLRHQLAEAEKKLACGTRARACGPDSAGIELEPLLSNESVQLPGDAVPECMWKTIGGWSRRFLHIVTVMNRIAAAAPNEQAWYVVDIGTSYGHMGDDAALQMIGCCNYRGFLAEPVQKRFESTRRLWSGRTGLTFYNGSVTPQNVEDVFAANDVPAQVDLIKLDIDGFDCPVLDSMLRVSHAKVISMEINQFVPPPTKFACVTTGTASRPLALVC